VAQHLGPALDRSVIVENRTGGDGLIGIKSVKGAAADGSTILVTTGPTMYLLPMTENQPSFDTARDFVPVSLLARFEFGVVASPAIGVKDFKQLVAWLKANPDKATFGVPSNGTIPHFTGSKLEQVLGISMTRVPYRGSAPIINDLIGGHLPFGITTIADAIPQHRAGGVRILTVSSAERSPFLPDVQTLKENGVGVCRETGCGCRRDGRQTRGEGKTAGDRADPGRLHSGRPHAGIGCQHGALAADRESDRLQDHELRLSLRRA
jgi:tripartite-type tricarboxylate transporter receptor subunit TctC